MVGTPSGFAGLGIVQVMEGRKVLESLTVEENLRIGAYTRRDPKGVERDFQLIYDYFPRLVERRHQLAGYLSGGEQQMLVMSRALMARPRLLLLDEPSLGLAPLLVREIFEIIQHINAEQGTTFLLVEQNAQIALSIAHYGYIMENGGSCSMVRPRSYTAMKTCASSIWDSVRLGVAKASGTSNSTNAVSDGCFDTLET